MSDFTDYRRIQPIPASLFLDRRVFYRRMCFTGHRGSPPQDSAQQVGGVEPSDTCHRIVKKP